MVDRFTPKPDPTSALPPAQVGQTPAEGDTKPSPSVDSAIPAKFDGPESLAKAYRELEQKLSEMNGAPPAADPPETPAPKGEQRSTNVDRAGRPADGRQGADDPEGAEGAEGAESLEIPQAASDAGLSLSDFQDYVEEFAEKGQLSDESYEALKAKGLGRDLVDTYIAGQHALAERSIHEAYKVAGGQESYQSMVQWAAQNLSEHEQAAYNAAVESGDRGQRDMAISGLRARFQASQAPKAPQLLAGDNPTHGGATPFANKAQMTAAMQDPRYAKDPAFREEVMRRLASSNIF